MYFKKKTRKEKVSSFWTFRLQFLYSDFKWLMNEKKYPGIFLYWYVFQFTLYVFCLWIKLSSEATCLFLLVWIRVKILSRCSFILTVPCLIILLKFEVIYSVHQHINFGFFLSCSSDHSILYQQIIPLWDIQCILSLRV